jgi:thioredoxin reductase
MLAVLHLACAMDGEGATERRERCVIGAGAAGLQLGFFFEQAGRDYVILERAASAASFFQTYPRHRTLISINKRHTGHEEDRPKRTPEFDLRHDWNSLVNGPEDGGRSLLFTNYSRKLFPDAGDLVRYLQDFALAYKLRVRYEQEVTTVSREADGVRLRLTTAGGVSYSCAAVVAATGLHTPYVPGIRGIELAEGYDEMNVDPEGFEGQSVLILGNGNAAFETAANLMDHVNYVHLASKSAVRLTIETHYVGDVRLMGNRGAVLEGYQLKSLNGLLERKYDLMEDMISLQKDPITGRIRLRPTLNGSNAFHTFVYPLDRAYDRVLRCLGWEFDPSIFARDLLPAMMNHSDLAAGVQAGHASPAAALLPAEDAAEMAEAAGEEAPVAAAEEVEELLAGSLELKVGRKWRKRWVQLVARSAGGELRVHKKQPAEGSAPAPPELSVALNVMELAEAERALAAEEHCADHKNCAEFATKLGLKLGEGAKDCERNAKELYDKSPDVLMFELCPESCGKCPQRRFGVAEGTAAACHDGSKTGRGVCGEQRWLRAPNIPALRKWITGLQEVARRFGNAEAPLVPGGGAAEGAAARASASRKYPALTPGFESTNVPGLYFAGTLAHGQDWRQAAGGFIHGFRYTCKALHRVLEARLEGAAWPESAVLATPADVVEAVRRRVNEASSLYQMVGHMADVLVFPAAGLQPEQPLRMLQVLIIIGAIIYGDSDSYRVVVFFVLTPICR